MPFEVLLHISSYLTTTEYCRLRLVCKHLDVSFFTPFAMEFFSKRQFMITDFSLGALVDISKSRFGPYLRYLIIGLEEPSPEQLGNGGLDAASDATTLFLEMCTSHQFLTNTGQDFELLREALENLPGLTTIGLRDYSSRTRFRDGLTGRYNSYGLPTVFRETAILLDSYHLRYRDPYVLHVFVTILRAIGKTARTRPKRFEVILKRTTLVDQVFHIPRYLESTVTPVLANLNALYLDLNDDPCPGPSPRHRGPVPNMTTYIINIKRFLSKAHSLEHLRLNFQRYNVYNTSDLLQWLSMPVNSSRGSPGSNSDPDKSNLQIASSLMSPCPIKFAALQQLELGFAVVKLHDLIQLYENYKSTLRTISLHKVSLKIENVEQGAVNLWAELFDKLSMSGLSLRSISLTSLQQFFDVSIKQRVIFKNSTPEWEKKWSGDDPEAAFKDFKDDVFVEGLGRINGQFSFFSSAGH